MGHVLDKYGIKMSKHKGNVVDPWTVMNKQGADAIRWYFYVNSAPWLPCRFDDEAVDDAQRKFMLMTASEHIRLQSLREHSRALLTI